MSNCLIYKKLFKKIRYSHNNLYYIVQFLIATLSLRFKIFQVMIKAEYLNAYKRFSFCYLFVYFVICVFHIYYIFKCYFFHFFLILNL